MSGGKRGNSSVEEDEGYDEDDKIDNIEMKKKSKQASIEVEVD